MGLFGNLSGGKKKGGKKSTSSFFKQKKTQSKGGSFPVAATRFNDTGSWTGGYGAMSFGNIMDAHSGADELIDEFGLDEEGCSYKHPYFGCNCYQQAYKEAEEKAKAEATVLEILSAALGLEADVDEEDLIDEDEVASDAYDYAEELADMYISGTIWIPSSMLEWAYYDVSDHNG